MLAVFYPFYYRSMFTIPVFGAWPDVATGVYMLVFMMMAVGLNIVVGYAGLLDLGYVAFYATGAYTAAWFASPQFAGSSAERRQRRNCSAPSAIDFGASAARPAASTSRSGCCSLLAGVITALFGIVIGLPTLRLRGDYLAIVTLGFGEILPQIARNGDNFFGTGFNLTNGPNGITPLDSPGFGNHLSNWTGGFLPANYLHVLQRERPRPPDPVDRRLLLDGDRAAAVHRLLLAPAAVTRGSAAPGSRSARTRPPPPRWASR